MSTTASSGGSGGPPNAGLDQLDLDPEDIFQELIWENPEICNDCFAKIRDRTELDAGADRLGTGNQPTDTLERFGVGEVGYDAEDVEAFGATPMYLARTFCGECGRRRARPHDLSLQEAVDRVGPLIDRLREQDIPVDEEAVYALVRECKSRDAIQGYDTEIFDRATRLGVRRAR